jgi:hypothetical protein
MDDDSRTEIERLTNQLALLKRRYMTAIFDDNTVEVRRTREQMRAIELRCAGLSTRLRSGFDVVA